MSPSRHRRSIRLQGYDYTQSGAYFVTICTDQRACLFGEIADRTMILNPVGEVVQVCWDTIPAHFPTVELDAFVVMPNHVHGVLVITDDWKDGGGDSVGPSSVVGATDRSPLQTPTSTRPNGPRRGSLGAIVGQFKSSVTRETNRCTDGTHGPIWQRNYYEHILRSERDLNRVRGYIETNPAAWLDDDLYRA